LSLAVPTIVIVGGLLGLLPLSGVATPFLSYGKSSMICNFAAVAIVLAIARRTGPARPVFARQVRTVSWVLFAVATALVGRTAMIQVVQADTVALRPNLGRQADGALRFQYNPRLLIAAGMIHRGTIYDRNGFALATSNSNETQPFVDRLAALELAPGEECAPAPARCYPLGGRAFHLLGDSSRQTNWSAHNASFVERDSNAFLQGFDDHAQTVLLTLGDGGTQMAVLRDYRDLLPLVRNKGDASNAAVRALLDKERDIHLTLDGPLQLLVATALETRVREAGVTHGAAVVMDVATGAILASASYPWPTLRQPDGSPGAVESDQLLDRARYGLYPPGSTFKLVTACAALNASLGNVNISFSCERLSDGRVGARVKGIGTLRDDLLDPAPHGRIDLLKALVVSCNAYFGQLAVRIGADRLADTAAAAKIQVASQPANLRRTLPFVGYGQGEVVASPIRMARVAAAIANDGILRDPPLRQDEPHPLNEPRLVSAAGAAFLRGAMRHVVTMGTGRVLSGETIPIAGKTGTAELHTAPSHSWFVGFAPYGTETRQIAFAIIVENAGYGSRVAAPLAGDIVKAAHVTGVIR
jgi:cell division protein FtsI/penicillin-binding protein 2